MCAWEEGLVLIPVPGLPGLHWGEEQGGVLWHPLCVCLPCWSQPPLGDDAQRPVRFRLRAQLCPCGYTPLCPWRCWGLSRDLNLEFTLWSWGLG